MLKKLYSVLFISVLFIVLNSCGSGGSSTGGYAAPYDATLAITPVSLSVVDGSLADTHTTDFNITVKTANGVPLSDVELRISFVWADPDGLLKTLFYDITPLDLTNNICGDGITETPLAQLTDNGVSKHSPMYVKTDKNGSYILRFRFLSGAIYAQTAGSCTAGSPIEWSGVLQVMSGSLTDIATVEIKAPTS